jgi:uncharacterized iron-regulated membrane protein
MRPGLKRLHLWLGLTLGLFWALQGMTGACLVFHHELERLAIPRPTSGPMAPIQDTLRSAAQESHGGRITRLSIADAHSEVVEVSYIDNLQHPRSILIDAATTRLLDERDLEPATPFTGSASRWVLNFHTSLLSGRSGAICVGISGVALFTAAISGLYLAWPARNGWGVVYSFRRWRTNLQRLYGWHRALGLTAAAFILFLALSGVWMTFEDHLRPALARIITHQLPYQPIRDASQGTVIPAQRAIAIAQARLPDARWARITLPTAKSPVYTIRFHRRGEGTWLGRTSVAVGASTGRIESVYDSTSVPLSNRIADALLPLHDGERFGAASRVAMMLAGLSIPTLYVTAVWRWFTQRRKRFPVPSRSSRERAVSSQVSDTDEMGPSQDHKSERGPCKRSY